jgi:hypothetical protein
MHSGHGKTTAPLSVRLYDFLSLQQEPTAGPDRVKQYLSTAVETFLHVIAPTIPCRSSWWLPWVSHVHRSQGFSES